MSFKININSFHKSSNNFNNNTPIEDLANNIDDKTVKIKNDGNNNFIYKLSSSQKNTNQKKSSKIIFDESKNRWVLSS
jgi:hypothetical protein